MLVPFLICLSLDRIANIIQELDDYQKEHYGLRFKRPAYLDEIPEPIINAPDYEYEEEKEIEREMSRASSHTARVK